MLQFSITLSLKNSATINDIISICNEWIRNSPHTSLSIDLEKYKDKFENYNIECDNEKFTVIRHTTEHDELCGVKYISVDSDNRKWTTEIVCHKDIEATLFSIRIFCETKNPIYYKPDANKPYILKLLLNQIGLEQKDDIPITSSPKTLAPEHLPYIAEIINGNAEHALPCIYVSTDYSGEALIDANKLAYLLHGIAHIFVEPSWSFSQQLRERTSGKNPFKGAIGIYFPRCNDMFLILPRQFSYNPIFGAKYIFNKVRDILILQEVPYKITWNYINDSVYTSKLNSLKCDASATIDEYTNLYEQENTELREQNSKLESQNEILRSKILHLEQSISSENGIPVLYRGDGDDHYPFEANDILLDILEKELDSTDIGTRRHDIIQEIISSNSKGTDRIRILNELKTILRDYKTISDPLRSSLERLGFILTGDKHYKLRFKNSSKYTVTLPASGSDRRGGKNTFRDIKKQMF